ncbi:MAG: DMT family transporter [Thermofilum sp.]
MVLILGFKESLNRRASRSFPVSSPAATALSLIGALCFSGAAVLYRSGMQNSSISPLAANALRSLTVLPLLAAIGALTGASYEKPAQFYILAFLSMLFIFFVGDSLLLYGLGVAPISLVYPAAYTYPLFTVLFSKLLLGVNAKPSVLAAALLIIGGVTLAYWGGSGKMGGSVARGLAAGLGASVSWGLGITLNQPALYYSTPVEFTVVRLVMLLALSLPVALKELSQKRAVRAGPLVLGGLLGVGAGPLAYLYAIEMVGVVEPSVISSSTPVLALLLGGLTLKEKPGFRALLGSLLVAAGISILVLGP